MNVPAFLRDGFFYPLYRSGATEPDTLQRWFEVIEPDSLNNVALFAGVFNIICCLSFYNVYKYNNH